jgi:hypothetical protein
MPDSILNDSILESTTTTGTGTINLSGAQTGYETFVSNFATGSKIAYVIEQIQTDSNGNTTSIDREVGIGTLTDGTPDTISRDIVLSSSNSDALVNFPAGTKDVYCTPSASSIFWNLGGAASITSDTALTIADCGKTLLADTSGGGFTQTLPSVDDVFIGWEITIVLAVGGANLIIDGDGSETINGAANKTITTAFDAVTLVSDGSNFFIKTLKETSDPFSTADVKLTYKTTADDGYVMADDGSIGNGSSGASNRANSDTEDLFTFFWNNTTDSECPVSSGRGASAAADFAANKTLTIPQTVGRALAIAGSGSGLTARTLADTVGEETHVQTEAELAAHVHSNGSNTNGGIFSAVAGSYAAQNTGSTGSSTAFNVMQPTTFLNIMVKL